MHIKKILLVVAVLVSMYNIPTHAFGNVFEEGNNVNTPSLYTNQSIGILGNEKRYTKSDACIYTKQGWNDDIAIDGIKWPGETQILSHGVYKQGSLLYYGVIAPTTNEAAIYTYDCSSKKTNEFYNFAHEISTHINWLSCIAGINIHTINSSYMHFKLISDGCGGMRSENPLHMINMKTLEYSEASYYPTENGEDIKNLNTFVDTYKGIIKDYENEYKDKVILEAGMGETNQIPYPANVASLSTYDFSQLLIDFSLSEIIKIHGLDKDGNGYISMQLSLSICKAKELNRCGETAEQNLLPMITAPINIFTRQIDISKILFD